MESQSAYSITPTDRSGLIVIVATLFMSWMVLVSLIRLYMRLAINGPPGMDDWAALAGGVFGIANVAAIMSAVSHGLGKSSTENQRFSVESPEKALYAADILFLAGHCAAKISVCLLLKRLGTEYLYLVLCKSLLLVISLWGLSSILATSLKCQLSRPWTVNGACTYLKLRWTLVTSFDVIIEVLLVSLSIYLVWGVRTHRKRKAAVIFAFATRVLIIILAIVRQSYFSKNIAFDPDDILFNVSEAVIATEVLLHCSIMAATLPCLKPFVISFNTGWGQGTKAKGQSYYERSADTAPHSASQDHFETLDEDPLDTSTAVSLNSQNSRRLIIFERREWTLDTEHLELQQWPVSNR